MKFEIYMFIGDSEEMEIVEADDYNNNAYGFIEFYNLVSQALPIEKKHKKIAVFNPVHVIYIIQVKDE